MILLRVGTWGGWPRTMFQFALQDDPGFVLKGTKERG